MNPKKKPPVIALCGNPNTGKSTIFNALTGSTQKIGNWPGATVEKKSGKLRKGKKDAKIIDLPGTYSLSAYTIEEIITRKFIVEEKPDAVIVVADASNLERNLYLAVQLRELGANIVLALNMMDVAKRRGHEIDAATLSGLLGCPVVPLIADKEEGIDELIEVTLLAAEKKSPFCPITINYGNDLEDKITELAWHICAHAKPVAQKYSPRYLAVKLLENDAEVLSGICESDKHICGTDLLKFVKDAEEKFGEPIDIAIASRRYGFINGIIKTVLKKSPAQRIITSDHIDRIITNPILGIPIFLGVMYLFYQFVFLFGDPLAGTIDSLLSASSLFLESWLVSLNSPPWLISLITSGILRGMGNVLVFLPNILILFLGIAILEDTGYMARAAFVMNRAMQKIGLHGQSFIPLVLGFGCNVPAVLATRTLRDPKDRLLTILINPLVPCSARMEVFVFIAGAIFAPAIAGQVIFSLLLASFLMIALCGILFRKTIAKGERAPFVMELPPYHVPTLKGLFVHMWERTTVFLKNAGTFIFLVALLLWFLASYPEGSIYGGEGSYVSMLGDTVSPLFAPLGFDSKATVSLIFGFFAKETVISAFSILYGSEGGISLADSLSAVWSPLQAYVFMVFMLIYIPCIATVSAIRQETRSWKWVLFTILYSSILAWIVSFIVLNIGRALGYS